MVYHELGFDVLTLILQVIYLEISNPRDNGDELYFLIEMFSYLYYEGNFNNYNLYLL